MTTHHHSGYFWDQYPYYVHRGYLYRYSPFETCDYELVDSYNLSTYAAWYGLNCQEGFDLCSDLRDELNWYEFDDRYFCAEAYDLW